MTCSGNPVLYPSIPLPIPPFSTHVSFSLSSLFFSFCPKISGDGYSTCRRTYILRLRNTSVRYPATGLHCKLYFDKLPNIEGTRTRGHLSLFSLWRVLKKRAPGFDHYLFLTLYERVSLITQERACFFPYIC